MTRIFPCAYATAKERAAATVVWINASVELGGPARSWTAEMTSSLAKESGADTPQKRVGAKWSWQVTAVSWSTMFPALTARPGTSGESGVLAAEHLHNPSAGKSLRLIRIDRSPEADTLACFALSDRLYLFDPKTGLWEVAVWEAEQWFVDHMFRQYGAAKGPVFKSFVVPLPIQVHFTWFGPPSDAAADPRPDLKGPVALATATLDPTCKTRIRFWCLRAQVNAFTVEFKKAFGGKLPKNFTVAPIDNELPLIGQGPPANPANIESPDFKSLDGCVTAIINYLEPLGRQSRAFAKDIWSLYCLYMFGGYHVDTGVLQENPQGAVSLPDMETLGTMTPVIMAEKTTTYQHWSGRFGSLGQGCATLKENPQVLRMMVFEGNTEVNLTPLARPLPSFRLIDSGVMRTPKGHAGIERALKFYIFLCAEIAKAQKPANSPLTESVVRDAFRSTLISALATGLTHSGARLPGCDGTQIPAGSVFDLAELNLRKTGGGSHR